MNPNRLLDLYTAVESKLALLDFTALWPGFYPLPFALYNHEHVIFRGTVMDYRPAFIGNTTILYENQQIAIWDVSHWDDEGILDSGAVARLAAGVVHEMFHGFQALCGDTRYPNDLQALCWQPSSCELVVKQREFMALAGAVAHEDKKLARYSLAQFVGARGERRALAGNGLVNELMIECLEGLAEFVGLRALRILDGEGAKAKVSRFMDVVTGVDGLFQPRLSGYASGTLFFMALERHGFLDQVQSISAEPGVPYFDQIDWEGGLMAGQLSEIEQASRLLREGFSKAAEAFSKTCESYVEVAATIVGYDPINTQRDGDLILCNHFVMLAVGAADGAAGGAAGGPSESMAPEFIRGPLLLKMEAASPNEIMGYWLPVESGF